MADVDVDHGGIIMASAVVVGRTTDRDSADHDLSKVTTNLPSMTVPSTTVTPGWAVYASSLVPLRWRCHTATTGRVEELIYLSVGPGNLLSQLWTSRSLLSCLYILCGWCCLHQSHLLLLSQVLHLDR